MAGTFMKHFILFILPQGHCFIAFKDKRRDGGGSMWDREKERETWTTWKRNIDLLVDWIPPIHTPPGDGTCNLGMCPDLEPLVSWSGHMHWETTTLAQLTLLQQLLYCSGMELNQPAVSLGMPILLFYMEYRAWMLDHCRVHKTYMII